MKKIMAFSLLGAASFTAFSGPLDYNATELTGSYTDISDFDAHSILALLTHNTRTETNVFYELKGSYGVFDIDALPDQITTINAAGSLGYAFQANAQIEIAPSIEANYTRQEFDGQSGSDSYLNVAVETTITAAQNLYVELAYATSLDSDIDGNSIYVGLEGQTAKGNRWEAGYNIETESDTNALAGRFLFPTANSNAEWYIGGGLIDFDGVDGITLLAGYRWNL